MAYINSTAQYDGLVRAMQLTESAVNSLHEFNASEAFEQASARTRAALNALHEAQDKFSASELTRALRAELQVAIKEELRLHAIQSGTSTDLNTWIRHMQKQYKDDSSIFEAIGEILPDLQKEIAVLRQIAANGYFDWHNETERTGLLQRWDTATWDRFHTALASVEDRDGQPLMSFGTHRGVQANDDETQQTMSVDFQRFDSLAKAAEQISAGDYTVHAYAVREDGVLVDLTSIDKDSITVEMSQRPDGETSKDAYFRFLRGQLEALPDATQAALTYANRLPFAQAQIAQVAAEAAQFKTDLADYNRTESASWLGLSCFKKLFNNHPELGDTKVLIIKHSSSADSAEGVAQYMEAEGSLFRE